MYHNNYLSVKYTYFLLNLLFVVVISVVIVVFFLKKKKEQLKTNYLLENRFLFNFFF